MSYIELLESPSKNTTLYDIYFRTYDKYSDKYGKNNTIFFMQVGSFHEAYQTLEKGYELQRISDVLNIIVSRKDKSIIEVTDANPMIMGFPTCTLNKYLKILLDNDFTVVIADQVSPPPNPKRAVTNIYTRCTYLENTTSDSNNILSIYIEELNEHNKFIIGLSLLDLTTGKSIVHELYSVIDDEKICLDETTRFMHVNQAKEIVITSHNINEHKINEIITYLEITDKTFHHQQLDKTKCKISFQQTILKKVYKSTGLLTPIEYLDLEKTTYGRLAFILLLDYAYDHSHDIINSILKPTIYDEHKFLLLGNNAIFQLNLLTCDDKNMSGIYENKTRYRSLFDVINKTSTPMGMRFLQQNLTQPSINVSELQRRYNFINKLLVNNQWKEIEKRFVGINDIEKFNRKIDLKIIHPLDLYKWIESVSTSTELLNYVLLNDLSYDGYDTKNILMQLTDMLTEIAKQFNIVELQKYLINDMHRSIYNKNIHKDVDVLREKIIKCTDYMDALAFGLSNFIDNYLQSESSLKCSKTKDGRLIHVEHNERDGHYLELTKRRADVLEQLLNKKGVITFKYNDIEYTIHKNELIYKHNPKGNTSKIFSTEMGKTSFSLNELTDDMRSVQKDHYMAFLEWLTINYGSIILQTTNLLSMLDFLKAGAKIAVNNHYCIPTIEKISDKSYFKAIGLRHPIVELLRVDNEYIPTNIELGTDKQDGILLFGVNASGKSTVQKAIGIAIIMAQMGFPVASKEFKYYPYKTLFTRIASNDNLFKGLSSFALEMTDLRAIIKRSDMNSIVIADEVCKGTENISSLIIVLTMLEMLAKSQTSFISATHLHDLTQVERLKNIKNIKFYHLHVEYDEKNNTILYDRTLKEGSGDNFYGLNVAKYLIADDKFMKLANEIKKEVFELPDLLSTKQSNYNPDLYMDHCCICNYSPKKNEKPLESHHITYQKEFKDGINENKFHLQKNHKSNLVPLCQSCHDKIDDGTIIINGWKNNGELDFIRT